MDLIKNITHLKCMHQMHSSHLVVEDREGLLFFDNYFSWVLFISPLVTSAGVTPIISGQAQDSTCRNVLTHQRLGSAQQEFPALQL